MSVPEIKNLDKLLLQHLGGNKAIVATKITRLTAPGDNYGSEMLLVNVTVEDETKNKEELSVVAKLTPENDFFRKMFNVQVSFVLEKAFYDTLVPSLQEFQRERGVTEVIDSFARFYGARNNLGDDHEGPVDKDAVLVLENLKIKGYVNVDRHKGFDLVTTKHLLSVIAKFHAVPLAVKLQDPGRFSRTVEPFFACNHSEWPKPPIEDGLKLLQETLGARQSCKHLIPKLAKTSKHFGVLPRENFREPFATLSHRDLWVNNLMVKFEEGVPVDSKIVDFQMYSYDSPAVDLFFFLMTSVETEVIRANLDRFLEDYHRVFAETLEALGCDVAPFSYEKFMEEMAYAVQMELLHIAIMLGFVIHPREAMSAPGDSDGSSENSKKPTILPETLDKIWWLLEECEKRGWMDF